MANALLKASQRVRRDSSSSISTNDRESARFKASFSPSSRAVNRRPSANNHCGFSGLWPLLIARPFGASASMAMATTRLPGEDAARCNFGECADAAATEEGDAESEDAVGARPVQGMHTRPEGGAAPPTGAEATTAAFDSGEHAAMALRLESMSSRRSHSISARRARASCKCRRRSSCAALSALLALLTCTTGEKWARAPATSKGDMLAAVPGEALGLLPKGKGLGCMFVAKATPPGPPAMPPPPSVGLLEGHAMLLALPPPPPVMLLPAPASAPAPPKELEMLGTKAATPGSAPTSGKEATDDEAEPEGPTKPPNERRPRMGIGCVWSVTVGAGPALNRPRLEEPCARPSPPQSCVGGRDGAGCRSAPAE
mmetsp:Transcript_141550/g.452521  ORF Transcript_141550/g.452521 Transcript_141550/m.452521 type:complete len:371 (+) Transcript_141550:697-1809(+)